MVIGLHPAWNKRHFPAVSPARALLKKKLKAISRWNTNDSDGEQTFFGPVRGSGSSCVLETSEATSTHAVPTHTSRGLTCPAVTLRRLPRESWRSGLKCNFHCYKSSVTSERHNHTVYWSPTSPRESLSPTAAATPDWLKPRQLHKKTKAKINGNFTVFEFIVDWQFIVTNNKRSE